MLSFKKSDRLASVIKRHLANLLCNSIEDPRLRSVTITDVVVNTDYSRADVYFSVSPGENLKEVQSAFSACARRLRKQIASSLSTYSVPFLRFKHDNSLEHAHRIEFLLASLDSAASTAPSTTYEIKKTPSKKKPGEKDFSF